MATPMQPAEETTKAPTPAGGGLGRRSGYGEVPASPAGELLPGDLDATVGEPAAVAPSPPSPPAYDTNSGKIEVLIDDAVDALGTGRFQLYLLFAAGLCFMADSMEIMLLSFLSEILAKEWGLTGVDTATITSCVFAGSLIGTLFWGRLGDRVGRRPVFVICALIISIFGFTTALATEFVGLVFTRFMVGFGVGGLTVPFDILAEFLPTRSRGKYLMLIEYFWTAGSMAVPVLAYLTVGQGGQWQVLVALCAIPCLVSAVIGICLVPESPRWLVSQGREVEALIILRGAAARNGLEAIEVFPEGVVLKDEHEENSKFTDLFKPKWRKLTMLLWGTWIGYAFGYYGAILAVTRVFESDQSKEEAVDFDYSAIFISASSEFVGTTFVIFVIDSLGRIPTQVFSYTVGGLSLALLCFLSHAADDARVFLIFLAFLARVCEMMGSCTTWVTTAEVLSTEIRTTGHSAANAVGRLGGFFSPYLVSGNAPLPVVGGVMLAVHAVTAFCASQLPETKGRALGKGREPVEGGEGSGAYLHQTELGVVAVTGTGEGLPGLT